MKERWRLIQDGIDRKSIKISGSAIYVNKVKSGTVNNGEFKACVGADFRAVPGASPRAGDPSNSQETNHSV